MMKPLPPGLLLTALFIPSIYAEPAKATPGRITLTSGNTFLAESFEWAKRRSLELVVPAGATQKSNPWLFHDRDQRVTALYPFKVENPGPEWQTDQVLKQYAPTVVGSNPKPTMPSYWGTYAYPSDSFSKPYWTWTGGRECFCTRDICHQALGAHLLGLDSENFSMLRHFAAGANSNDRNPHWPKWSYSFFGTPYYMDADWRELPAPLELGEKLGEQWRWTGDRRWIDDPEISTYHANLHGVFMSHQDMNGNGIADETIQLATLWETVGDKIVEAGDSFGCQYQALLAYSRVLADKGDKDKSAAFRDKADALRQKFHKEWYNPESGRYIRGFRKNGEWADDWGHESTFFMPMKLLTDLGPRTEACLDLIFASDQAEQLNIEAKTYLPEVFYKHGRNAIGWHYLEEVMKSRNIYPEVAFTSISNTVCGLMGLDADAPARIVTTVPRLTPEVPWVECKNIPVGDTEFTLRHDGVTRSTLTNQGSVPYQWSACFYGLHPTLKVNGKPTPSRLQKLNGKLVSAVVVPLGARQSAVVEIPEVSSEGDTAASVATAIRSLPVIAKDVNRLPLPAIPPGFALSILDTSDPALLALDGKIVPPKTDTLAGLVLAVTKKSDGTKASTPYLTVSISARTAQSAEEAARSIKRIDPLPHGQDTLKMPTVPPGYTIKLLSSAKPEVIGTDGRIRQQADECVVPVVFEIQKLADRSTARTTELPVFVPSRDYAWLSSMDWVSATASFGTAQRNRSVGNNPIRLAGVVYPTGLGTHANSEQVYQLGGKFAWFQSIVGVDDGQSETGSVVFEVYGDGRLLHRSPTLRAVPDPAGRAEPITLDIRGVSELKLRVTDAGDGINCDHANWGICRLVRAPGPTAKPEMPATGARPDGSGK